MRKFFLVCIACIQIFSSQQLFAQKGNSDKIRVFSDNAAAPAKSDNDPILLKLNPLLYFNGEMPLIVEKHLSRAFSVELGVGPTFKDYILYNAEIFGDSKLSSSDPIISSSLQDKWTNARYGVGWTIRPAIRFYLDDDYPEGPYISLEGRIKTYNMTYNPDPTDITVGTYKLSDSYLDIVGTFGKQYEIAENLYLDSYTGLGLRSQHLDYLNKTAGPTGFEYSKATFASKVPVLTLGFKLAYGFAR